MYDTGGVYSNTYKNKRYLNKKNCNNTTSKKLISTGIIVFLVLLIILLFVNNSRGNMQYEYGIVEVKKGDTLWNIIGEYNIYNDDPRKLVTEIKRINDLDTAIIYPGQCLKIPNDIMK